MTSDNKNRLDEILIRTDIRPGDLGTITWMHGKYYAEENGYGLAFECYVAGGLAEFYRCYDVATNRIWTCMHRGEIIGSLCLMRRGDEAQLRYFFIRKPYRGIKLGRKLMMLFMDFLDECGYASAYLWTVKGLPEAAALYTAFGFVPDEEKASDAFGPALIEQKYVWKRA